MSTNNDPTAPQSPPMQHEADPITLSDYDAPMLIKREKLFTKGTMALAALLIGAGGFTLGGYFKHTPAAAVASTQRTNTAATGRISATGATGVATGATGVAGRATGAAAAGGGFAGGSTIGQVTAVAANTITVQDNQGNIIKIMTSDTTPINIAKAGAASDLSVGETIVVQGAANADGSINATAINAGAAFATRGGRGGTAPAGSAATGTNTNAARAAGTGAGG